MFHSRKDSSESRRRVSPLLAYMRSRRSGSIEEPGPISNLNDDGSEAGPEASQATPGASEPSQDLPTLPSSTSSFSSPSASIFSGSSASSQDIGHSPQRLSIIKRKPVASAELRSPAVETSVPDQICPACKRLDRACVILWSELKKSASDQCKVCRMVVNGIDGYFNIGLINQRRNDRGSAQNSSLDELLRVHLDPGQGPLRVGLSWSDEKGLFDQCEFYTRVGDLKFPLPGIGTARSVAKHTDDALATLKSWITQCRAKHPGCYTTAGSLPLRVVDVGKLGTRNPFLYISRGERIPFTALSHCWGTTDLLCTTRSNIDSHKRAIPWKALSKNFQDAVTTTQYLNIRYLWIDSLCILQDDNEDWQVQSAKMAAIYSKAQIVLAATDAEDGTVGFMVRNSGQIEEQSSKFESDSGKTCNVYVRNVHSHNSFRLQHHFPMHNLEHPLLKRAWAFQEQLLATKIVHFTKSELIWECKTALACECMNLDLYDPKSAKLLYHRALLSTAAKDEKFMNWQRIIHSYMSRGITFEKDRIPALSGLAAQMQAAGAGQYLMGLWRENLISDLVWTAGSRRRSVPYRAPTWSWASTEGGPGSVWYRQLKQHEIQTRARLIGLDWISVGNELNCTVRRAALTLAAPMVEVQIVPNPSDRYPEDHVIEYRGLRCTFLQDLEGEPPTSQLFCLLIDVALVSHVHLVQSIILRHAASGQEYERVGTMVPNASDLHPSEGELHRFESETLHPDRWFGGVEESIVTII